LPTLLPTWPASITDLNIGLVALVLNVTVMFAVSAMRPTSVRRRST
jgi:hypothetical protein